MKILYSIKSEFPSVFFFNGAFNERSKVLSYPASSPLFVTALPLTATLLPYTVELLGGKPVSNGDLATSIEVQPLHFAVRLKERHNYVYSPLTSTPLTQSRGVAQALFGAVKSGDLALARSYMTKELSASVDDTALAEFFADYSEVVENDFEDIDCKFFLINKKTSVGEKFNVEFSGERVSNMTVL